MPKEAEIKTLAKYLSVDENTITNSHDDYYDVDETGEEYLICKDENEAFDYVKQYIVDCVEDMGLKDSFTKDFYKWIIHNAIDEDFVEDCFEDILFDELLNYENQRSNAGFENFLVEFLYDNDYLTDDDFEKVDGEVDYSNLIVDIEDVKQRYVDSEIEMLKGYDIEEALEYIGISFEDIFDKYNIFDVVDFDKVTEEAISLDGRGHFLSGYDGEEIELTDDDGNVFYAYRTN